MGKQLSTNIKQSRWNKSCSFFFTRNWPRRGYRGLALELPRISLIVRVSGQVTGQTGTPRL